MTDEVPAKQPKRRRPAYKREKTSKHWLAVGPLTPWMLNYLQWLASEPSGMLSNPKGGAWGGVTMAAKTTKASWFAKRTMGEDAMKILERRPDAIAYFEKLRADLAFKAREMLGSDIVENIEARREGLRHVRGFVKDGQGNESFNPLAVDPKQIRAYTEFVTEIAFPKKAPGEEQKARIIINIGSIAAQKQISQALGDAEDVQDIEYEVIEQKQLTDGEDDG